MATKEQRDDIRTYYRGCVDPQNQIRILCELFPHLKMAEILEVLQVDAKGNKVSDKQEDKEDKKEMARNANGYHADVKKDVCNGILNEGLSYSEAAEKWGVPLGNIPRWVTKAREQQAVFSSYEPKKEQAERHRQEEREKIREAEKEHLSGKALVKSNDKSNDFSLGIGEVKSLGILNEIETELFEKIVEKLEIFNKGYRYAKGGKL